ncbi:MAG: FeoB-associated Cys-rich membrane protein [Flavobacterium sp.]|uniref:FeoB-associated Cys-rich membrane protein n=1 Tax=Flavobacterium sp. TaxID=239 RepID=UPI003BA41792
MVFNYLKTIYFYIMIQTIIVYILVAFAIIFLLKPLFVKKKSKKNCGGNDCGCH